MPTIIGSFRNGSRMSKAMHGCRLERRSEVLLIKRRTGRLQRPIAETVGFACLGDAARRARPLESAAAVCNGGPQSREGEMWMKAFPRRGAREVGFIGF
jgi:hypothetical protein